MGHTNSPNLAGLARMQHSVSPDQTMQQIAAASQTRLCLHFKAHGKSAIHPLYPSLVYTFKMQCSRKKSSAVKHDMVSMAVPTAIHSSFSQPYQQESDSCGTFLVLVGFILLRYGVLEFFQDIKKRDHCL